MYNTTEAVKNALGQSVVRMRLLSESVSLLASDAKPIQSSDGKPIWVFAVGPFPDGKVDGEQLSSLSYSAGCCDGDIGIGNVSSASLSGTIHGVLNLLNVTFTAQVGVDVDGETQWMNLGKFTVTESTRTDDSTTFTAYDAAYTAFGQTYTPAVLSGSTGRAILEDISSQTGVEVEPSTLALCTMQTDGSLTGHTYREMVGYIAALCGKNAVITRDGFLRFVWFASTSQAVTADDYYSGDMSNGGKSKLHGIACTVPASDDDRDTQIITVGESDKAVEIVNPYMTQSMLNSVWSQIGGYEYPVGSVGFYKGILTEPGDIISLTNLAGVTISFPVMQVSLEIDGGCRCSATSYGKSEADRGTGVKSPMLSVFNRVLDGVANGVYDGTSVASVTRFYQLGDTAPAAPTTKNPPSGWGTTEPGYTENNPEHLYFVDRTIYDNDTYQYSTVSLSSSYEAAKAAYQKAQEAQETAEDAMDAAEDAMDEARNAMTSANGKNKVFHQSSAPSSSVGLTAGDIWFDTANDNQINTWTGSAWSAFELGEDAIANLSITNAKIANATIDYGKIASLDMGKATTGKLLAQYIDVVNLFAQDITATNSFKLDTTNCKLKAYGNNRAGFSLGVKNSSDSNPFTSGISAYDKYLSLYTDDGTIKIDAGSNGTLYIGDSMYPMNQIRFSAGNVYLPDGSSVYIESAMGGSYTNLDSYIDNRASYAAPSISVSSVSATVSLTHETYNSGSFSVYKNGYTPLGIVGYDIDGTKSNLMVLYGCYISGTTCYWHIRSNHTADVSNTLLVRVLYIES